MIDSNAAPSSIKSDASIKSDDFLENRLREATTEESRQLLDEFLRAFYLDQPEIAVIGMRRSAVPELRGVTIKGQMAE